MCYKKTRENYPEKLGPLTKHHLTPKSIGGERMAHNVSYVPEKLHQHWHAMFCNFTPHKIARIINEHWIPKHLTMMVLTDEELAVVKDALSKHHLRKY